jgi:alpha-galactosidase
MKSRFVPNEVVSRLGFAGYSMLLFLISGFFVSVSAVKAPALHPPMGWNSYNCYGYAVTEKQFMQNVHYMADNLKKYGWEYCIVDFIWWIPQNGVYGNNQSGKWDFGNMDNNGRFWPDTSRFPSAKGGKGFKALSDSVHNLGLKFGIHVMRGIPRGSLKKNCTILNSTYTCTQAADQSSTCAWMDWMYGINMTNPAGQAYLNSILSLYDSWGVDFIKVDDLSSPYHSSEVVGYANAIASVSREIVLSTSPGPTPVNQASHIMQYANMWRLVNDLWDTWAQLTDSYRVAESWRNTLVNGKIIAGPGHWPDVDMLPFGHLALYGPVGNPRYSLSSFTKGEHRLLMSLWCINNQPLMYGGNMPDNNNNPFYDSLIMNKEAIYINQNGINGKVFKSYSTNTPIWVSTDPVDTTVKFLLLGNISSSASNVSVQLSSIGINKAVPVWDVWAGVDLGTSTTTFSRSIPSHDAGLYILGNRPTAVNPAALLQNVSKSAGDKVLLTSGNRCAIPDAYKGKTVKVSTFSLGGQLLNSTVTHDRSIKLYNDKVQGKKVGVVKITESR